MLVQKQGHFSQHELQQLMKISVLRGLWNGYSDTAKVDITLTPRTAAQRPNHISTLVAQDVLHSGISNSNTLELAASANYSLPLQSYKENEIVCILP